MEKDTIQTFEDAPVPVLDAVLERALVCKLDMRVLPTTFLISIMNYIDRIGITTARLKGLESDLGLTDLQYSIILSVLYATYCPAQIPSNMALNYIRRPSLYIGGCVVLWGLITALTGVMHSFRGILACRLCLDIPYGSFEFNGKANWLEGMILMCLYAILCVTFWFYPGNNPSGGLLMTCT